jgi:drug/metabolite transporter (DMT)-like permease
MSTISIFFGTLVLPFILTFVVVFAILQKSKVLGDGKVQIDAMVAAVIGFILIGFPQPRDIIVGIMPWIAVGISVILMFLILYGFVAGDLSKAPDWMKTTFGVLAALFTVGVVLFVTGLGRMIWDYAMEQGDSEIWMSLIMLALIIGVALIVVRGSKPKKDKKD